MIRKTFTLALLATIGLLTFSTSAWAQATCVAPTAACGTGNVTTSQIQIGGVGSISSNNTTPATCDGGTPGNLIGALFQLSFDRGAGQLTIVATNTTQAPHQGALTGFAFNTTPDVTLVTLASENDPANVWSAAFDRDRTDSVIEIPTGSSKQDIKCDGFGRFNVFSGNKGVDTGFGGGDAGSILPGGSATFVFDVTGNLAGITACSFTSVASLIPPGDKTAIAVGRFQACNGGGSAWAGPCQGGDLLVSLVDFQARPGRNRGLVSWETASEIDNAGFYVLRKDSRKGDWVRVNQVLIPGQGSETSGAAYSYEDLTAQNGKRFYYALEDMEFDGDNTIHHARARTIVINPETSPIALVGPAYEASVSRAAGARLGWETNVTSRRNEIEISSDPAFAEASTVRISAGSTKARSLTRREMDRIADLAALSGEGGVYWRVNGNDGRGGVLESPTYFFYVTD